MNVGAEKNMTEKIPKRLDKEPLIEAIWQVQFEQVENQPVGDILPGILFSALRREQQNWQLKRLPAADIPPLIAQHDTNLRYAAKYRIDAADEPYLYHVGDRVVALNCRKPYVGWQAFKSRINTLIDTLEQSGLMPAPQRHSLRYIDLMTLEPPPTVGFLQLALTIGNQSIERRPLQLRVEVPDERCTHVLQIATPAQVRLPEGERTGTLIDLETLTSVDQGNWSAVRESLETLHTASKSLFFLTVLTPVAIAKMGPEY